MMVEKMVQNIVLDAHTISVLCICGCGAVLLIYMHFQHYSIDPSSAPGAEMSFPAMAAALVGIAELEDAADPHQAVLALGVLPGDEGPTADGAREAGHRDEFLFLSPRSRSDPV